MNSLLNPLMLKLSIITMKAAVVVANTIMMGNVATRIITRKKPVVLNS
jgi:hypothetical protein